MTIMDKETKQIPVFAETDIAELCDAIKSNHEILKAVGGFFQELGLKQTPNSNVLLTDFKKWGIRTIASQVLEKQFRLISRIQCIYQEEQDALEE